MAKPTDYAFAAQRIAIVTILGLSLTSCFFSAQPIYNNQEQAVAERAVSQFHDLHNRGKVEAICDLMDKTMHNPEVRAKALADIKAGLEAVGRVQSSTLVEKKVFPSPGPGFTSQVKLGYDTEFEKGEWAELFAWNIINSREAILVEYRIMPRANQRDSQK